MVCLPRVDFSVERELDDPTAVFQSVIDTSSKVKIQEPGLMGSSSTTHTFSFDVQKSAFLLSHLCQRALAFLEAGRSSHGEPSPGVDVVTLLVV